MKSQRKGLTKNVRQRYLTQAEDFYARGLKESNYQVDYAMYQRAKLLGYLGDHDKKINVLESLTKKYMKSEYRDDGMFDLARAYDMKSRYKDAIDLYEAVINEYPNSRHVKNSLLNTGLIFRNTDRTAEAKAIFWRIVTDYT